MSAHRNDIIHHRFMDPGRPLTTDGHLDGAIAELQECIRFARPFTTALRQVAQTLKGALDGDGFVSRVTYSFQIEVAERNTIDTSARSRD